MKLDAALIIALMLILPFAGPTWAADEEASEPAAETPTTTPPPTATQPVPATTAGAKKDNRPGVLDFEAELIEGERKSPDMFLQLQSGTPNLDAILFQRTNFNDFHNLEKHRRPLYRRYVK